MLEGMFCCGCKGDEFLGEVKVRCHLKPRACISRQSHPPYHASIRVQVMKSVSVMLARGAGLKILKWKTTTGRIIAINQQ
jgi:hypothetical protein